jgi:hypothetical protein
MPGVRLGGGGARIQGSEVDLCRAFGWEVEAHAFTVAMAADLVALWQLADYTNRV